MLLAGVVLKLEPVIVTIVPIGPEVGLNDVSLGVGAVTVKSLALCAGMQLTVTITLPVVAPLGTVVVMLVLVLAITTAGVILNRTVLLLGMVLKFVPVMITVVPMGPESGENPEIVGGGMRDVSLSFPINISCPPKLVRFSAQAEGSKSTVP
jgi:hypothetical protein